MEKELSLITITSTEIKRKQQINVEKSFIKIRYKKLGNIYTAC